MDIRERLALRNKVKEEEHSRELRGVKRRYRNENVFARPNGLYAKTLTLPFRVGDLDLPERRDMPAVGTRKK